MRITAPLVLKSIQEMRLAKNEYEPTSEDKLKDSVEDKFIDTSK